MFKLKNVMNFYLFFCLLVCFFRLVLFTTCMIAEFAVFD